MYTVDYFIDKFSKIPEDKWHAGGYWNTDACGNRMFCALGHCGEYFFDEGFGRQRMKTAESKALWDLVYFSLKLIIQDINDAPYFPTYMQQTPKQRILAALYDIKRAQYPELTDLPVTVEDLIGHNELVHN